MWEAAQLVKAGLEEAGYTVKMLRNSKEERVNFAERAERARGSAMVVSLHSNAGGDNWIAYQMVGGHRVGPNGTLTFENADTANKSKACAEASAQEMGIGSQAGINFNGREGIAPGDLPWVQLLSPDAPWIYHEVDPPNGGGGNSPMGAAAIKSFADGVVAGLKKCNISPSGSEAGAGNAGSDTTPEGASTDIPRTPVGSVDTLQYRAKLALGLYNAEQGVVSNLAMESDQRYSPTNYAVAFPFSSSIMTPYRNAWTNFSGI
jgi:hypothetical protein